MKRRLIYVAVALAALITAVVLARRSSLPEPVYQGKTVTEWIKAYGAATRPMDVWYPKPSTNTPAAIYKSKTNAFPLLARLAGTTNFPRERPDPSTMAKYTILVTHPPASDPAVLAIRKIGPPAVPYLIDALGKQDTFFEGWQRKWWAKSSPTWRTNLMSPPVRLGDLHRNAVMILSVLGKDAVPAVPALITALDSNDRFVRRNAVWTLVGLGRDARAAIPALKKALNDADADVSMLAFVALDGLPIDVADFEVAIRQWRNRRGDREVLVDIRLRDMHGPAAALALGQLLRAPGNVDTVTVLRRLILTGTNGVCAVPQLIPLLREGATETSSLAIRALNDIGPGAKAALPALARLKEDQDSALASAAADAIRSITEQKTVKPEQQTQ